jgi:hypothetical protein
MRVAVRYLLRATADTGIRLQLPTLPQSDRANAPVSARLSARLGLGLAARKASATRSTAIATKSVLLRRIALRMRFAAAAIGDTCSDVLARTAAFSVDVRAVAPKPIVLPAGYRIAMPHITRLRPLTSSEL